MTAESHNPCEQEFDFALVVGGVPTLSDDVENALYEAGCDDATLSIRYGLLYMEFSRSAGSLKDAIISAISDVLKSGLPAEVLMIDDCNLVTQADIARRIDRSRQLVNQYISGQRGPGGFPPPVCHITDRAPLWTWCSVSHWLAENNLLRAEISQHAEVVEAINYLLERRRIRPELFREIEAELDRLGA